MRVVLCLLCCLAIACGVHPERRRDASVPADERVFDEAVAMDTSPDVFRERDVEGEEVFVANDVTDVLRAPEVATDVVSDAGNCAAGETRCSNVCVSVQTDRANCGACGRRCGEFEACVAGVCGPDCRGTTLCGGNLCRDLTRDVLHCGRCGNICATTSNGVATCVMGTCAIECNAGYQRMGATCVATTAATLRLLAPLSGSTVTTQRPTFRWQLPSGATGARVDICADRACSMVLQTFDAVGSNGTPPNAITRGVRFWRATPLAGMSVAGASSAVWQCSVPMRSAAVNTAWGTSTDWNGDGFADLAITSAMAQRLFVYNGSASGVSGAPNTTVIAPMGSVYFGLHAASAGDVNGDGYADLLVQWYATPMRHLIYHGSAAGIGATPNTTLIDAMGDGASTAQFAWGVGDVNGDGFGDVVVSGGGMAKLYLGASGGLATSPALTLFGGAPQPMHFGWPPELSFGSIAPAGDTNGDGFADVAVTTLDGVQIHLGGSMGLSVNPAQQLAGTASFLGPAGDVNGDGYADLLLGMLNPSVGARVFLGGAMGVSTTVATTITVPPPSTFVWSGTGAADTNGDGFAELAFSLTESSGGTTYVHHGAAMGASVMPTRTINGPLTIRGFGRPTVSVGDTNGDGFSDVVLGGIVSGVVSLFRGGAMGLGPTATNTFAAPAGIAGFGSAVASSF